MNKATRIVLPGLLLLAGRPSAPVDYPFAVGETLRYQAFLGSLPAGTATVSVARTETAKDYTAGHRLYGLVNGDLLWAYDMAAMGNPLQPHLSATLKRA